MGALLLLLGVAVAMTALAVGVLHVPSVALSVAVVVATAVVVVVGFLMTRVVPVVRLDETGYEVRLVRGAGVRRARWKDVEDVVAATLSGQPCVVLRLRDGRTTAVPVALLDAAPDAFMADLRAHLDRGHGYRALR